MAVFDTAHRWVAGSPAQSQDWGALLPPGQTVCADTDTTTRAFAHCWMLESS
jgi:hypothetical protein